jgi:excisionase family DNA binding protein
MPQYLTVSEIQDRLNLRKPDAVLAAIAAGELKAVNVGAGKTRPTWRVSEEDFREWLDSRRARPAPAGASRSRRKVDKPKVEFV